MRNILVTSAIALAMAATAVTVSPTVSAQQGGAAKPVDLSGDWGPDRARGGMGQSLSLSDIGGRKRGNEDDIPYQPWARAKTLSEKTSTGADPRFDVTTDPQVIYCEPPSVPHIYLWPIKTRFVQTPEAVYILYELGPFFRVVWLNSKHPDDPDPQWWGHSIGHYENGDTLVVDTIGFNDKTWLDQVGHPHTEQLHLIERYKRVNQRPIGARHDDRRSRRLHQALVRPQKLRPVEHGLPALSAVLFGTGEPEVFRQYGEASHRRGARQVAAVKIRSTRTILGALGTAAVSLLTAALAGGQTAPVQRPPMAEDVFKNVQVLKGTPVNQFMETMGFFSASLGADCTYCHVQESGGSWEKYADDNAHKRTARRMVLMMSAINRDNFAGRQVVTCYTCHRGGDRPKVTPSLAALYGALTPEEPTDVIAAGASTASTPGAPTADQILDKYIDALGGAERLATLTSVAAKGTSEAYADRTKHPVDVFAKAPAQRATIVHAPDGDSSTVFDGRAGWIAAPISERPVRVLALSGGDLDAGKLEAALTFPGRIKQTLTGWRVGFAATIDDRDVDVLQGTSAGGAPATFYFDKASGLLVRLVRYADSPVGRIPLQTDYADYREVSGIKMPFRWTATWLDGRATIQLSEVRVNVQITAARFAKPVQPSPSKTPER